MQDAINHIRAIHRERCFVMEQRKRMHLALAAFLRLSLGWRKELPEAERNRISKQALEMAEGVESDHPLHEVIAASIATRAPFDTVEKAATKKMEKLAKGLPVWKEWGEGVRAFGARSLAVIVGEAGDLANYPTHSHLWKRMGLSPYDGHAGSTWRREAWRPRSLTKKEWENFGYNAKRRSHVFCIGDSLVKQGALYREVYLSRKQYERDVAMSNGLIVAPVAKIPKGKAELYISDGHIHKRAQRYMEKRLLRDLWKAWRRDSADVPDMATDRIPSA